MFIGRKLPISTLKKEEKRFHHNPSPIDHYEISVQIVNAPGSFNQLTSSVIYEVPNNIYKLETFAGAAVHPEKELPLVFRKIADDYYKSDFYIDAMKDEDYYGQGISKWAFRRLIALFSATDSTVDTKFSASISLKDVKQGELEIHHLKQDYPRTEEIEGDLSTGINHKVFTPDEYFTFHIEIKKIQPCH